MVATNKAIVLVSGGLDSTTTLVIAQKMGFACYALSFDYGQQHISELQAARRIVADYPCVAHKIIQLDLGAIGGSALTDSTIPIEKSNLQDIPKTYVPARNTLFLSYALAWAEVLELNNIFIGVNAVDYSGYPDCRPEYIAAYEQLATLATKLGVNGVTIKIHTPLIHLSKAAIIKKGIDLGIDYALTISCYRADEQGRACGHCDSCYFRKQGFADAQLADPTRYYQ